MVSGDGNGECRMENAEFRKNAQVESLQNLVKSQSVQLQQQQQTIDQLEQQLKKKQERIAQLRY